MPIDILSQGEISDVPVYRCYFSKFDNTRMVADRIANALSSAGPVRVVSSDELSVSDIEEMDLVIMGTPTYNMKLPKSVKPVLEELRR